MILVVGGAFSGKTQFVKDLMGIDERSISENIECDAQVFDKLEEFMRDYNGDLEQLADILSKKAAVICREVGCGVIPIDENDSMWRERVGRLCCLLAKRADKVIRMSCGIPTVIKGEA